MPQEWQAGKCQVNDVIILAMLHTNNTNALWSHGSHHRWSSESTCSLWEPWFAAFWWTTSSGCARQHTLAEQSVCAPLHRAIDREQHKAQSTATILHPFWYSAWIDSNWIQGGIHVFNIQRFRTSGATAPEVHNYCHARTHATATHTQINNCKKNYSQVLFNKRLKFLEGALRYQPVIPRWRLFTQMKISFASIKANMQALRTAKRTKKLGKKEKNARGINTLSWFEGRNITLWRGETC